MGGVVSYILVAFVANNSSFFQQEETKMSIKWVCTQCEKKYRCKRDNGDEWFCKFCSSKDCSTQYMGIVSDLCNNCRLLLEARQVMPTEATCSVYVHYRRQKVIARY